MKPAEKARAAKGPVEAMRMYEKWGTDLALDTDLGAEQERELDAGVAVLQERFPEITKFQGSAEEFAQSKGHGRGSRAKLGDIVKDPPPKKRRASTAAGGDGRGGKKGSGGSGSNGGSGRSGGAPGRSGGGRRRPATRSKRGRGRRRGRDRILSDRYSSRRLLWDTGIPGAASSATGTAMMLLGATVGLSLLFLLLSSAQRPGSAANAFPYMLRSITEWVQRFVGVGDIFSPGQAIAAGERAGAYTDRVLRGEAAGPPNPARLRELLPELPPVHNPSGRVRPSFKPGQKRLPRHLREGIANSR